MFICITATNTFALSLKEYTVVIPKEVQGQELKLLGYSITGMKVAKIKDAVNRKFKPGETSVKLEVSILRAYLADVFRVKIHRLQKVEVIAHDTNEGVTLVLHYK